MNNAPETGFSVCPVCSVEFPVKTLWYHQCCTNGHAVQQYLRHDSAAQIASRIEQWSADFRWWKPDVPVHEEALMGYIGLGFPFPIENVLAQQSERQCEYYRQYREMFREAMNVLGEGEAFIAIDGDGVILDSEMRWIGRAHHWHNLVDRICDRLAKQIDSVKDLDDVPGQINAIEVLSSKLAIEFKQVARLKLGMEAALKWQEEKRIAFAEATRAAKREYALECVKTAGVAFAGLFLVIFGNDIAKELWASLQEMAASVMAAELTTDSLKAMWQVAREENKRLPMLIIAGFVLAVVYVVYIALQVPLFYLLAGVGLLLSFVVYEELWLLFVGLLTIGLGVFVFQYWRGRML